MLFVVYNSLPVKNPHIMEAVVTKTLKMVGAINVVVSKLLWLIDWLIDLLIDWLIDDPQRYLSQWEGQQNKQIVFLRTMVMNNVVSRNYFPVFQCFK